MAAPFAFKVGYARTVGAPRIRKLGEYLGGVYSQTGVTITLTDCVIDNDQVPLDKFVEQTIDKLPLSEIGRIVAAGRVCFFSIGVFTESNLLCDFGGNLLSSLAAHGVGLKLDIYGGPE